MQRVLLPVVLAIAACGGSQPARAPVPASEAAAPETEPARDPAAPTEARSSDEAVPDEAWPVTLLSQEGVWSMHALGADRVVLLAHASSGQRGYDPMGTLHLVEVRALADFSLRWRVVMPGNATEVAASADGSRVLVQLADRTRVLRGADGARLFDVAGPAYAAVFDERGGIVRAARGSGDETTVELVGPDGAVERTVAVSGAAPSTIHAMRVDGECDTIYTSSPATVHALASAGGWLAIGASDGTVRVHALARPGSPERRLARADVRTHPGGAVSAIGLFPRGGDELVAVYSDGSIVRWDLARGARLATVTGECAPDELARIAVIEGLPRDVEECGVTGRALVVGERVILAGSSGARVRTLSGARLAGFPTLHANGVVLAGDEVWLAGTDPVIERWSLDGRFLGVHRAGTGWARVVALAEDHVAIQGTREGEVHGQESEGATPTVLWRISDGARLPGFEDVRGQVRFVGDRAVVALADGSVAVRALTDGRELARFPVAPGTDAGASYAPAVPLVPAYENAVVLAGGRVHLVTAGGLRELGPSPPAPEGGLATGWSASADGARLARLVFDAEAISFRLESWALGASPRLLFALPRAGEHAPITRDGARIAVSSRGTPTLLLDAETGAPLPLPPVDASWVGFDAQGVLHVQSRELGARLSRLEGARLVPAGPTLLVPEALDVLGDRAVVRAAGGAHVLDGRGRTLAYVGAVAGSGFAMLDPTGLIASTPGVHAELARIVADRATPLDAHEARPERWTALLRR